MFLFLFFILRCVVLVVKKTKERSGLTGVNTVLMLENSINSDFGNFTTIENGEDLNKMERVDIKLLFVNLECGLNVLHLYKIVNESQCKLVFIMNDMFQETKKQQLLKQLNEQISTHWTKKHYFGDTPDLGQQCHPFEIESLLFHVQSDPFVLKTDELNNNNNMNNSNDDNSNLNSKSKILFDVVSWCVIDNVPISVINKNPKYWNVVHGRYIEKNSQMAMTGIHSDGIVRILNDTDGITKHTVMLNKNKTKAPGTITSGLSLRKGT